MLSLGDHTCVVDCYTSHASYLHSVANPTGATDWYGMRAKPVITGQSASEWEMCVNLHLICVKVQPCVPPPVKLFVSVSLLQKCNSIDFICVESKVV